MNSIEILTGSNSIEVVSESLQVRYTWFFVAANLPVCVIEEEVAP
jgi:hypothetical protein